MEAEEFYKYFDGWKDDPLKDDGVMITKDDLFRVMEEYAREKIKEFILFYNNRQSKVNTIALKDEMESFYDEN